MIGEIFGRYVRLAATVCALALASNAGAVTIQVQMDSTHFRRAFSPGTATCSINLNTDTGDFTLLGNYQNLTTPVTGIGLRVPGKRVPGLGRRASVHSCAWDSNSGDHGNFSSGGTIPMRRIQSVLNGKAEVVILTQRYPKGEVGGRTPRVQAAQAGLSVVGCLVLCGARRGVRGPASR